MDVNKCIILKLEWMLLLVTTPPYKTQLYIPNFSYTTTPTQNPTLHIPILTQNPILNIPILTQNPTLHIPIFTQNPTLHIPIPHIENSTLSPHTKPNNTQLTHPQTKLRFTHLGVWSDPGTPSHLGVNCWQYSSIRDANTSIGFSVSTKSVLECYAIQLFSY